MVRCEQFYEHWERRGNFCNKSDLVAKKVEDYINYVKRNKLMDYGGYRISNCALDPFMNIEHIRSGKVHSVALRDLKNVIRKEKVLPEKVTRRVSVEIINKANNKVNIIHRLDHIPNIRSKIGEHEHEISEIGFEIRNMFDEFKKDIGAKNNNEALKVMLELCVKNPDEARKIKEDVENKEKDEQNIEILQTA